ncbi:helix-turn-helix domain-containing protein [Aestuariibaculum sp. M13]|uniref:helix-turn-helix domain-containing protein n=1 Tax=Aestuariibaculum sp. M13 TaxID=2967132 RepID=UPI002159D687|nr:helix-turn-helix domain-containing protein [Aestuariibaculum sp. M13]MCR8668021.1 helix-turn-helix domain-containing protein [Aestuariibaculum sp. M13]
MSILKSIREKEGYTQTDLANQTGLSLRTIQRLESTNKVPKGYTLNVLAEEFNMEPSALQAKYVKSKLSRDSEITTIKMINLSVLSFIGIPFGNLILPIILWRNNRDSKFVDEIGRRVVNFQILFTLFLCLLLILLPFTVAKLLPNIPIMLIVLLIAYLFNIAVIIRTAIKIQHQDFDFLNGPFRLI